MKSKRTLYGRRGIKAGMAPGSLVYLGDRRDGQVDLHVTCFDARSVTHHHLARVEELDTIDRLDRTCWINVDGLHDLALMEGLARRFGIHNLVMEDILNTNQRPKVEFFESFVFATLKMIRWDAATAGPDLEQVSIVFGRGFVITFQEAKPGDVFDSLRARLEAPDSRIRHRGADYLAYALMDVVVDHYFHVLEHMGEDLERLEEDVLRAAREEQVGRIQTVKGQLLLMRRAVYPLRDMVGVLLREESDLVDDSLTPYLRDLHDHVMEAMETVESFRDMAASVRELYLSGLSHAMNQVMKVLTIIATIFIPLTFLAGVYGMNFQYMPELSQPWAYPALWGVFLVSGGLMVWFFRRRKWL